MDDQFKVETIVNLTPSPDEHISVAPKYTLVETVSKTVLVLAVLLVIALLASFAVSMLVPVNTDVLSATTVASNEIVFLTIEAKNATLTSPLVRSKVEAVGSMPQILIDGIKVSGEYASGAIIVQAIDVDDAEPDIILFVAKRSGNSWKVVTEEDYASYLDLADELPENITPASIAPRSGEDEEDPDNPYLALPWAVGATWRYTGGPHNSNGCNFSVTDPASSAYCGGNHPWSSLDYNGTDTGSYPVVASRDGIVVYYPASCPNFIRLDHADTWKTGYYHLRDISVSNGQFVTRGTLLGMTSSEVGCGGSSSGNHVHFSLRRYGNVRQDLIGQYVGGWHVLNATSQYRGCTSHPTRGIKCPPWVSTDGAIYNDGSIGNIPSSGTAPPPSLPSVLIPSKIQAEDYIAGGQNEGYFDTTSGNFGGAYRNDDVDIEVSRDIGGGYNVGWISNGEWTKYRIRVEEDGVFNIHFRVAKGSSNASPSSFRLELNNQPITNVISINNTGGWQVWKTLTVSDIELEEGVYDLKLYINNGLFNINWIDFEETSTGTPPVGFPLPGKIQAEDYNLGGQNVGYFDTTSGNLGGKYRTDSVDIENTLDVGSGYNVGWVAATEWLKYNVYVTQAGSYTLNLRTARGYSGNASLKVEVDGVNVSNTVAVPASGGWQIWRTVSVPNVNLTQGNHVVRVYFIGGGFNLNWLEFVTQ